MLMLQMGAWQCQMTETDCHRKLKRKSNRIEERFDDETYHRRSLVESVTHSL